MPTSEFADIQAIHDFKSLIQYLRKELKWPVDEEQADDLVFDYKATELGIDETNAVKIRKIKQLRPLAGNQPWGVFWIEFDQKRLPVVVMRRILSKLVSTQRGKRGSQKTWDLPDLMFIASTGSKNERGISFAHFQEVDGKAQLRTFAWDVEETHLYYIKNVNLEALRWPAQTRDITAWRKQWSEAFIVPHQYVPRTAEMLAKKMAQIASYIREAVKVIYGMEHAGGALHHLHLNLKLDLISDLSEDDFADMYAQTVTYGLFAARATRSGGFSRADAPALIAHTNPFLRDLLEQMMSQQLLDLDELGVTELTELLKNVDMESVLRDIGRQKRGEDPVIHFYETFMREYDPLQKIKRGEFYTPDAVVSFIVRSVDYLLRTEFDCPDGFATISKGKGGFEPVVLDPATGTGTFPKYVIQVIWDTFYENNKRLSKADRRIKWNRFVRENVLPRLCAFEFKMSPYTIAHMKVGLALQEKGFEFEDGERLRIYLTNSLQPAHEVARTDTPALAHEAEKANSVKNGVPITIIIGNPPYSVTSYNKGEFIENLTKSYKEAVKGETGLVSLSDDYIKFIRYSQSLLEKSNKGIIGLVTNRGYLGGIVHRGMRQELLRFFDEIVVIDLHGDSNIGEKAPDGLANQNVFDIQQGVSIVFLIKNDSIRRKIVKYAEVWGTQTQKYEFLLTHGLSSIEFKELHCKPDRFFFLPMNLANETEYEEYTSIQDIFLAFSNGVKTHRDDLLIDMSKEALQERFQDIARSKDVERLRKQYGIEDTNFWRFNEAKRFIDAKSIGALIQQITYRPFDSRFIYYNRQIIEKGNSKYPTLRHMMRPNVGLLASRIQVGTEFNAVFCTKYLSEMKTAESTRSSTVFPIYAYDDVDSGQAELFNNAKNKRSANFSNKFVTDLANILKLKFATDGQGELQGTFGPEDVFHYMYAVFHSPAFRSRYVEFLKIDFPRLPVTSDIELFRRLCGLGNRLVSLHLLESGTLSKSIAKFKGRGDGVVESGYPKYQDNAVLVSATQGFEGVPADVWEFHIGGYQVCQKWLKDRRGRKLSAEDIVHYQKIVVALNETIRLMTEVDEVIDAHGGWPMK